VEGRVSGVRRTPEEGHVLGAWRVNLREAPVEGPMSDAWRVRCLGGSRGESEGQASGYSNTPL
jgi:hypothetical protein